MKIHRKEMLFTAVTGLIAAAAIITLPYLVAAPKLLFGRSLSAIEPALFPYITLGLIVALSIILLVLNWRSAAASIEMSAQEDADGEDDTAWLKTSLFFILLICYGLLLKPAGFLISSFLAISITSVMLGNRNWPQIIVIAVVAPACLYLLATRAMLVSLPELNQIELWYARVFDWVSANTGS
jgi:putative tricarboxylic transport membrane protein